MKKRKNFLGIILLIVAIFTSGCAVKEETKVERTILEESRKVVKNFEVETSLKVNVIKKKNKFLMYPEGYSEKEAFKMWIPKNFYQKEKFKVPEIKELELPDTLSKLFEKPRKIAQNYINNSSIIKEEDKKVCIEALEKATLHYCTFSSKEYNDILMITVDSEIYINSKLRNYVSEYAYLHEIIHIISNITNDGSIYEYSAYRSSKLNETITDLIAVELARENELSGYEISSYQTYYEPIYYVLAKFDMLKAYFYSDEYQKIISIIGEDKFNLYILMVDNLEECNEVIYYLINDFLLK